MRECTDGETTAEIFVHYNTGSFCLYGGISVIWRRGFIYLLIFAKLLNVYFIYLFLYMQR